MTDPRPPARRTALRDIARLETVGRWTPGRGEPPREVVVSLGEAELLIADMEDAPLAHWSLPALTRLGSGPGRAVRYAPAPGSDEVLEIDDPATLTALERVRDAVATHRPAPGRLRRVLLMGTAALAALAVILGVPPLLRAQAERLIPGAERVALGERVATEIAAVTGPACTTPLGAEALETLAAAAIPGARRVAVIPDLPHPALALPGGLVLLSTEGLAADDPLVAAGHLVAATAHPPNAALRRLLGDAGLGEVVGLLTGGAVADGTVARHARRLLAEGVPPPPDLGPAFRGAGIPPAPWSAATGTPVVADIPDPAPPLEDGAWQALREICAD